MQFHDFAINTILPIPKVKNASVISSDNFPGIALSLIFVKLFDNIVIHCFHDSLCTSELQFGVKSNSSTQYVYHDFKKKHCHTIPTTIVLSIVHS